MEEKIRQAPNQIPFSLKISEKGEINLKNATEITPDNLNTILDASNIRQRIYQQHQADLSAESNKTAMTLGVMFAATIGLLTFCLISTK
jgi:hypothetical protein